MQPHTARAIIILSVFQVIFSAIAVMHGNAYRSSSYEKAKKVSAQLDFRNDYLGASLIVGIGTFIASVVAGARLIRAKEKLLGSLLIVVIPIFGLAAVLKREYADLTMLTKNLLTLVLGVVVLRMKNKAD